MSTPQNFAAFLASPGAQLEVLPAPMPVPGRGELLVRNAAVALNPVDLHMRDVGVFVKEWPAVLGGDVAGTVVAVGDEEEDGDDKGRFKEGDRVIGYV